MRKFLLFISTFVLTFIILVLSVSSVQARWELDDSGVPGSGIPPTPVESVTQEVFETKEMNKGSYDADTVLRTIPASLTIGILGTTTTSVQGVKTYHPGAVTFLAGAIGTLYDVPPASGKEYFADIGRNMGFVQPAYAQSQGFGFEKLKPIQEVWKIMRNVVYLFFVIIFVIVGFMIMFRVHIDPRTVVSIQLALPQIIVALLLVTFSYAIAGFLIDITELSIVLVDNIFKPAPGYAPLELNQNIFGLMSSFYFDTIWAVINTINKAIGNIVSNNIILDKFGFIGAGIGGLIIAIAILMAMFRLFISLLTAYITIIFLIIFSPFMFLMAAIPGKGSVFGWFKNILSNILVFPAVAGLFIIGKILTSGQTATSFGSGAGWQAPFLGINPENATGLIGLALILVAPKIPDLIKEAFQTKASPLIGQAFGETAGQKGSGGMIRGGLRRFTPLGKLGI